MLIGKAMDVFWRSLKDLWEEMTPLAVTNLAWFVSWALPLVLVLSVPEGWAMYVLIGLAAILYSLSTAGLYHVTNRVAHGKTAAFRDFSEGVRLYWRQALLWLLGNALVLALVGFNIFFYAANFTTTWAIILQGSWLALLLFWAMMQLYFWPMLIQLEQPRLFMAWRYAAMLIVINPFYAMFLASFTLLALVVGVATAIVLALGSGALIALLGNNALLMLLHHLGKIPDPRPPVTGS